MQKCRMTVSGNHNFQWTYCPNYESVEKCNSLDLPYNALDVHNHIVYNHPTCIYCKMIDDTVTYFDRRPAKERQKILEGVEDFYKAKRVNMSTWEKIKEKETDDKTSKQMRKVELDIAKKLNYKRK